MTRTLPDTILMTTDTVGGVWTYSLELCTSLQQFDIQVCLATMGDHLSSSQWKSTKKISNLVIEESDYALEWMDDPWKEVDEAGQWLMELERKIEPDLIHLNNYAHGALPWNAPVLMVGHSCVLSWWKATRQEDAPEKWNTYAARVKEGLKHADYIVAVSYSLLDQMNGLYGPFSQCKCIYNARDAGDFYTGRKKDMIFSMGRLWDEAKNIASLCENSSRFSWPVYVAGAGDIPSESGNVTFLGPLTQPEVAEWLSRARIYVMPARYEPFGLSVLEAALSGCALVLGDLRTLREVWGSAALYADPDDPEELRRRIQSLIQNPSLRRLMTRKAGEKARSYSPRRFAGRYADLYRELTTAGRNERLKKATL